LAFVTRERLDGRAVLFVRPVAAVVLTVTDHALLDAAVDIRTLRSPQRTPDAFRASSFIRSISAVDVSVAHESLVDALAILTPMLSAAVACLPSFGDFTDGFLGEQTVNVSFHEAIVITMN